MTRAKGTTIRRYTVRCDCGCPIYVEAGKAGLRVRCPSCRGQISVPPLTELRESASTESSPRPFQYRLSHLLLLMLFWALLLAVGSCIGFDLWAELILLFLGVPLAVYLLRKGICAFWDFLDKHRYEGGRKP